MQTRAAIGQALTATAHRAMTTLTQTELESLAPLCLEREAHGLVRDGHGDLHARNICMTDPIAVYDCIEFSPRLRIADVAAELAFLLMDLDFRGRRDLAAHFLAAFQARSADPLPAELLRFHRSCRAWVRGKVDYVLAGEADAAAVTRRQALERSRRYFNLALGYHVPQPLLLLTSGLMGVGKTTLARALAAATGAILLRSDVVRKELAGLAPAPSRSETFASGLYAPAMTERTYGELRQRARAQLAGGHPVIVDASFARAADRQAFFALAGQLGIPAYLLHLRCPTDSVVRRLDRRQAEGVDASDGRRELLPIQAALFELPAPGPQLIEIDSSAAVDYNVQQLLCRLLPG
jgi:predicted kinase